MTIKTLMLLILGLWFGFLVGVESNCGEFTDLVGNYYNLQGLTTSQGYSIPSGRYTYRLNFCADAPAPTGRPACAEISEAYQVPVEPSEQCITLTKSTGVVKENMNGVTGVSVVYVSQQASCDGKPRIVHMNVDCKVGQNTVAVSIVENPPCTYSALFQSKYGCPTTRDTDDLEGLSGGSILLIILLVSLVVYIVGGVLFRWKVQHVEPSIELLPNLPFWTSIPGLFLDGLSFTKSKIMGLRG